jgi:baculoviral IAP repeat-containing protein 6
LQVLIAGPHDTPYESGLFLFDVLCGTSYPDSPPSINLMTTGGGSVRFSTCPLCGPAPFLPSRNLVRSSCVSHCHGACAPHALALLLLSTLPPADPNLYNCGKVCLSLLGTWSGSSEEMWNKDSTLLQLFVSIQALIFVREPYFNGAWVWGAHVHAAAAALALVRCWLFSCELTLRVVYDPGGGAEPGVEASMGSSHAVEASRTASNGGWERLRVATVRFAMLDMMANPPAGFEDVVALHFAHKAAHIRATMATWQSDARSTAEELTELTEKLEVRLAEARATAVARGLITPAPVPAPAPAEEAGTADAAPVAGAGAGAAERPKLEDGPLEVALPAAPADLAREISA